VSEPTPQSPARPSVWVCIPTYNERENVEAIATRLLGVFDAAAIDGHLLVIDDGSPDGTGAIADALAAHEPRIHTLHRTEKTGIGPAYRAGFRHAMAHGADLLMEMDCDLSHDPAAVPSLVAASASADLVLGSRYVKGGGVQDWGLIRRIISRGGSLYAQLILGVHVRDLTGGFKCFRREVLEALPLDEVASAGYVFQIEMTYRAILDGFRIVEVPITFTDRTRGSSKMSRAIVLEAIWRVPKLRRLRKQRGHRP